jgi:hypothetical protein
MPQRGEPVVCGRRICAGCNRWRHIYDFAYRKARNEIWITKFCWSCQRAEKRHHYRRNRRHNIERIRRWRVAHPERVAAYAAEDAASGKRRERDRAFLAIPENRERRRAYNRAFKDRQRRAQGVPQYRLRSALFREAMRRGTIDPAPFVEWITKRLVAYESLEQLAEMCQVNPRQLRTYRAGHYFKRGKRYQIKQVKISFVDRCLINEGWNDLWELYPELYDAPIDTGADKSALVAA